jgi:hypothetical protein
MKITLLFLLSLIAGLVSVQAQTNPVAPAPTPVDNKQSQATPSHEAKKGSHSHDAKKGSHSHDAKKNDLNNLTDTERQQLKAAMKKIKDDPQLVAARQAIKESLTKESKVAAHQALNQTRHDLLLKADPTIQPILDKIGSAKKNPAAQ